MSNSTIIDKNSVNSGKFTQRVMQLVDIMKRLVEKGKQGSVALDDWFSLAELVAVDEFERVGPFHDAMDWRAYTEMLTQWVNHSEGWEPVVKRITETPGLVYLQCEEMITKGDTVDPFYSLSLYEFNEAGKIRRIEVYMQTAAAAPH